jgi:hypothetical protein
MDEAVVTTKPQLVAAIKAGAQPTFELAKKTPFKVTLGSLILIFKEGLHERRAKRIIRNIHRTPAAAFAQPDIGSHLDAQ